MVKVVLSIISIYRSQCPHGANNFFYSVGVNFININNIREIETERQRDRETEREIETRVELLPVIYRFTGKLFLPFCR